jgi:transcriptional regulator with XRE-family HTH domain
MASFGKKLSECRKAKGLTQQEVAKQLNTVHTVIGRYERDEMKPTIDVIKKLSAIMGTTVGYLLGETEDVNAFRDPEMLKRINEINNLPEEEKKCVLFALDAMLRDSKTRAAYQ